MTALLSAHSLTARYGDMPALHGVDVEVEAGETIAPIDANGAGKSTLLRSMMGEMRVSPEMVRLDGQPVGGTAPDRMVRQGVAIVPEGRRLFFRYDGRREPARRLGARGVSSGHALDVRPDLRPVPDPERQAQGAQPTAVRQSAADGGHRPRVLLCDEISLGLAPEVIGEIYAALPQVTGNGTALVLVEQDVGLVQRASQRLYCLLEGRVTVQGRSNEISREAIGAGCFGVGHDLD